MHPTEFFLNPLTPELFMFGNKSLHSVDVSPKKRRDLKMSLTIKAYNEYLAAVKECEALRLAANPPKKETKAEKTARLAAEAAAAEAAEAEAAAAEAAAAEAAAAEAAEAEAAEAEAAEVPPDGEPSDTESESE